MTDDIDDLVEADSPLGKQELITRAGQDEMFCIAYVKTLSPVKAAMLAYGTEEKAAQHNAWRILKRPHIAERVAYLSQQAFDAAEIHPRQIVEELKNQALSDHLELFSPEMLAELGLDNVTPETRRAIESLQYDALFEMQGSGEDRKRVYIGNRVNVKFYNKQKALELLARMAALFKDRVEHTGENGTPLIPEGMTKENAEIVAAKIGSILASAQRRMLQSKTEDVEDLL